MYNHVKSKRILAKDVFVSNDTWVTGINNNDLLVGPPGGGKTRGYVIPNILHAQDSLIVADTKGNLCRLYGERLKEKGYTVMHLDFTDAANTPWGYNPLAYIRECRDSETNENGDYYSEQDIKKIAQAVCPNVPGDDPSLCHEPAAAKGAQPVRGVHLSFKDGDGRTAEYDRGGVHEPS